MALLGQLEQFLDAEKAKNKELEKKSAKTAMDNFKIDMKLK